VSQKTASRLYYGYIIVVFSLIIAAVAWGAQRTFGVFLDPLIQSFHWSRAATSLTITIQSLTTGLMAIVTGRLSDRYGARIVLTICGIFIGAGFILSSFIVNQWQLYLVQGILVGMGLAGIMVPLMSTVVKWFTQRAVLMNGLISSGQGLGTMVVPPVAAVLITNFTWQKTYLVIGIVVLVLIVVSAQFLKQRPSNLQILYTAKKPPPKNRFNPRSYSFREAFKTRTYWILSVLYFIDVFIVNVFMVHIVIHVKYVLVDNGGNARIAAAAATTILSAAAASSIFGRVSTGILADKFGIRWTIGIGLGFSLVFWLWVLFASQLWMFYLGAVVFGIGGWCVGAVISPLIAEYFGLKAHGAILGAITFIGVTGGAAGPLVAGAIYDKTQSYHLAFIVCAVMCMIGLILLKFMRIPRGRIT